MEFALMFILLAMCCTVLYTCYKIEQRREERFYQRLEQAITNALINSRINK